VIMGAGSSCTLWLIDRTNQLKIPLSGGGLGHIGVQLAAKGFGMRVIGIDHGSKRDIVLQSGAEHFIDHTSSKGLAEDVKALTDGLGAQAVLVMTASNAAYASSMSLLRFQGTLVCVGIPEGKLQPIASACPGPMLELEQRIVGSSVGTRKEAIETLEMAARGVVKTHYRLAKMEELTSMFQEMEQGKIQGRVILDLQ
jgi:propanol-preferring alcohol dehydrogenase